MFYLLFLLQTHQVLEVLHLDLFLKYFIYVIIGQKGSGKSTMLLNVLKSYYKHYYDNIYFCSTSAKKDDKFETLVEELDEDGKFYDTFSDEIMIQIIEKLEKNIDNGETRNLLILDDCVSLLPASTEKSSVFNKFVISSRHHKCDVIITAQKFNKMNTIVRVNLDIISIFPTNNKHELKSYSEELNVDDEQFKYYMDALQKKHDFLTISFVNGVSSKPKFYYNFNEIL